MSLSRERLARNQVIFREVNERLRTIADAAPDGKANYLCECTDVHCTRRIELRLFEYEEVRARGNCFFIVPGHDRPDVERIVDETGRYVVVEKIVPVDDAEIRVLTSPHEPWPDEL